MYVSAARRKELGTGWQVARGDPPGGGVRLARSGEDALASVLRTVNGERSAPSAG